MTDATVNIPKDVLEPIIHAQVAAGITAAIGDPAELIRKIVEVAMKRKVDADGKVNSSSYYNTHNMVELLAEKAIHQVVRETIIAGVDEQRPAIKDSVRKALARKASPFAKALMDGLTKSMTQNWSFNCEIKLER